MSREGGQVVAKTNDERFDRITEDDVDNDVIIPRSSKVAGNKAQLIGNQPRKMLSPNMMNMFHFGGKKIEHPEAQHSNHISKNVEATHKEFAEFQKNLNNLVMLYRTRHQLMDALNENGLYTAKCYYEMLDDSPLSQVLAPRDKFEAGSLERVESVFPSLLVNEEKSVFPSSSILACEEKQVFPSAPSSPSFEECEFVAKNTIVQNEPEGLKSSTQMSVYSSGRAPGRVGIDPPPDEEIPEDSVEIPYDFPRRDPSVDEIARYSDNAVGGCVNVVIVDDDDDSFTGDKTYEGDELMPRSETKNDKRSDKTVADEAFYVVKDLKTGAEHVVEGAIYGDEDVMTTGDGGAEQENTTFPVNSADVPDLEVLNSNSDEINQKNEYLNIGTNGDLVVLKSPPPKPQPSSQSKILTAYSSYHDVHKDLFKDTKTKLDEHSHIVNYVEDWDQIVDKCVESRYVEYSKIRSGLCHYEKKVDSMLADIEKLKQKNRSVSAKQIEKLERNQMKLEGTRKTHDKNGESLLMFLDEVVRRAWRDALPLLRKSIKFEVAFAAVNQEHSVKLGAPLKLLEIIGTRDSAKTEGRLATFENCNVEDIYTGVKGVHSE